jgi:hypothetical protein
MPSWISVAAIGATRAASRRALLLVVGAAEERGERDRVRDVRHRRCDRGGDRRHQAVAVPDVRQLVRDHAAQLAPVEQIEDALGDRDHALPGIASGGERIGRRVVDQEHARLGDAGALRQLLHHAVQARGVLDRQLARAVHAQHQLVGEEVRADVHRQREAQEEPGRARPDRPTDRDQEGGQAAQQQDRLQSKMSPSVSNHRFFLWP